MDGSFFPVHDIARDMPYEADEPWSLQAAVYHLKAMPIFLELTEARDYTNSKQWEKTFSNGL